MNILDLIFPKRCVGCGRWGSYFCDRCATSIKRIATNEAICPVCEKPAVDGRTHPKCQSTYALDGLTSFFRYDGAIRKAVKAVKYRFISDLAREFISLIPSARLDELAKQQNYEASSLVPIPLHPSRHRFRGFNQAEVMGAFLARRLHIPMQASVLRRIKKIIPQVEMHDRKERLENMKDVFVINNITIQQFSNVILFDDVFTTGATMRAAAKVLKQSGAVSVWAITMAR